MPLGTLVLVHSPLDSAAVWGDLPERLRAARPGEPYDVIVPGVPDDEGVRYVARASLAIAAIAPRPPLVLVAQGAAGPLLPALASAQRAAHRPVGGYLFVDAALPTPGRQSGDHDHSAAPAVPVPADWPDAPCGYLWASSDYEEQARVAGLRGWPVVGPEHGDLARALHDLLVRL